MYLSRNGAVVSTKTGRRYPHHDKLSKRAAIIQLEHEDSVFEKAESQRLANVPPDTRPAAERIGSEITHNRQEPSDTAAGIRRVITDLESRQPLTAQERNRNQRRIDGLKQRLERFQQAEQVKADRLALEQSPDVVAAIEQATKQRDDLRFKPDISQALVNRAEANLNELRSTCDVAAFRQASKALTADYNAERQQQIVAHKATISALESSLQTIREDEAPAESVQGAAIPS